MQTSYNTDVVIGVPGQPRASTIHEMIVSYPAGEVINFGRAVAVNSSGLLQQVQETGDGLLAGLLGVSVYQPAREQAYPPTFGGAQYQVGEMVPVMRRGRIFAEWNGTTQGYCAAVNVNCSSTTDTNRGIFTDAAISAVAGSEIAVATGMVLYAPTGVSNLCELDINLPAAGPQGATGNTGATGPTGP